MALPVLETPTFNLTFPGTNETYKFRPFKVKEEKLLTMASDGEYEDMLNVCQQVVTNCSFGEVDATKLPMHLLQWTFLQIRKESVGNKQEFMLICGHCKGTMSYEVEVDEFKINNLNSDTSKTIFLNEDKTVGMVLKFPPAHIMNKLDDLDDVEILKHCIDTVFDAEQSWDVSKETDDEVVGFVETLPLEALAETREFFKTMPMLEHIVEYTCPKEDCGKPNAVSINGYEHFFA